MKRLLILAGFLTCSPGLASGQAVDYYHLDAVGNVLAVTDQDGRVLESHDYLPFGEEWCGGGACSPPSPGQPKRFTGKERDPETGLDYFGARYYDSLRGRFRTVDPALDLTPSLAEPQRWNRYAYGLNNPLKHIDPDGRLTIIIHGTWAQNARWAQPGQPFNTAVSATFAEQAVVFTWSAKNNKEARAEAAAELAQFIAANRQAEEPLNIVAHSHGGNVVKAYTHRPDAQEIDTLVNLGTPQRPDYKINENGVRTYLNVFSEHDGVQTAGGEWFAAGQAFRTDPKARNVDVSAVAKSHGDLHTSGGWAEVDKEIPR